MSSSISDLLPQITSLGSKLSEASAVLATVTKRVDVISNSIALANIDASLVLLSNEQVYLTATAEPVRQSASIAAAQASATLSQLLQNENLYGMTPSFGGNLAMTIVMGVFFLIHSALGIWSSSWWFFVSFFCGTGLEFAGYIGRTLSSHNVVNLDYFLLQIIALTIAPVFIMAAVYYLLAQLIMIYGTQFSILKPMHFSYIFISCDIISLVIQAAGGGLAATNLTEYLSADSGTHVMVAGLAFQVFSMSVFVFFFANFLHKIKYWKREEHRALETSFNPIFAKLRSRKIFKIFPVIISIAVAFIYTRCIYRVIELAEGWTGFLIIHEVYFMILDALMMALSIIIFIPFHPGIVYARQHIAIEGIKRHKAQLNQESPNEKFIPEEDSQIGGI